MKKIVLIWMVLGLSLFATEAEEKEAKENNRLCTIFKDKVADYKQEMRDDPLAKVTLESYAKRADIFCGVKTKEEVQEKFKEEDSRMCQIFKNEEADFEKDMKKDRLALITLASFKKRTEYFCNEETLKAKYLKVREENKKLCRGYIDKLENYKKEMSDDNLSKETLSSFENQVVIFCSTKELKQKDQEAHSENERLCKIFTSKIEVYEKDMREDDLAKTTLESYKIRAKNFCGK